MNITKFQCWTIFSKYIVLLVLVIMTNVFAKQLLRSFVTILLFFFSFTNLSSQTYCNVCSQAEVDALAGEQFAYNGLLISGADITNLDSLYALEYVLGAQFWIKDNPLLENTDGLSSLSTAPPLELYDNPKLKRVNLHSYANNTEIINNNSLDSITIGGVNVTILDNDSLTYYSTLGLLPNSPRVLTITGSPLLNEVILSSVLTNFNNITITGSSLENLDGFSHQTEIDELILSGNTQLQYYCGLHNLILNDINANITLTGNLETPTNLEILYGGNCGIFVRDLVGYDTLAEALAQANDHSFIHVTRDYQIDDMTLFSGVENHTLVIDSNATLTFGASFTNEGIVINHGTLEMLSGSTFTNSGAFVNTGMLIAN